MTKSVPPLIALLALLPAASASADLPGYTARYLAPTIAEKLDYTFKVRSYPWGPGEYVRCRDRDIVQLAAALDSLYRSTCVDCHSFDGTGRGSDVTDNATDLTDVSEWVFDGSDAATFLAIRDGVGDEMPGFNDDFKDEKLMWHMVNYLRSLRNKK